MDKDEMIQILEELIRDESLNGTARCTAIRTLRELEPQEPGDARFAELDAYRAKRATRRDG